MSYELFFRSADAPPRRALIDWLAARPFAHVHPERVVFENEATGVYFAFDCQEGAGLPTFSLGYLRSHVFGLEAELTLSPFVAHFGLEISDPQMEGMGEGPYSPEGFLRGWNAGNRAGYEVALDEGAELWSLPREANHLVWAWNFARERTQALFEGADLPPAYVPTALLLLDAEGDLATGVSWTADLPLCFPTGIDWFLLPGEEARVLSRSVLMELIKAELHWPATHAGIGTASVVIDAPSPAVRERLLAFAAPKQFMRLTADRVLDRELVEAVRARKEGRA